MTKRYYAFLPVRDAKNSIGRVMDSLLNQSQPPLKIYVVDDGSTDGTSTVLLEYREKHPDTVEIIRTENVTRDYSRLASLWNLCLQKQYDYHMVAAGDTVFEKDYAKKILNGMDRDPQIVVASGSHGKKRIMAPHGGGRFVNQEFFFRFYDKYPEIIGYESQILFKARIHGYRVMVFQDAKFEHTDPLGFSHNFEEFGPSMRTMGYHPLYALGRFLLEITKNDHVGRRGACKMLWDYVTFRPDETGYYSYFPEEDRKGTRDLQQKDIRSRLSKLFNR